MRVYASNEPRIGIVKDSDGRLRTNRCLYLCRDAANAALFIRLAAPFADNLMNSVAHCRELPSATRGVLFVLKTSFFTKKIQKQEILPCKKLLFSLSVQNEEIPYKNS